MTRENTIPGLPPPPPPPVDRLDEGADAEALRGRRCLDGLWLALLEHHGTDALDKLLLDASRYSEPGQAWTSKRHALAREYAERLFRGRP